MVWQILRRISLTDGGHHWDELSETAYCDMSMLLDKSTKGRWGQRIPGQPCNNNIGTASFFSENSAAKCMVKSPSLSDTVALYCGKVFRCASYFFLQRTQAFSLCFFLDPGHNTLLDLPIEAGLPVLFSLDQPLPSNTQMSILAGQ